MFLHHLATIFLITFSYVNNMARVGTLVLCLHDSADVLLEAAKMANYTKFQKMCDLLFVMFAMVFVTTRLGLFPLWVLNTTLFESWEIVGPFPSWWVFNLLLLLLQGLNCFWSYLVVKIACKAVSKGKVSKDDRSDIESSSDDEDSEPPGKKPHTSTTTNGTSGTNGAQEMHTAGLSTSPHPANRRSGPANSTQHQARTSGFSQDLEHHRSQCCRSISQYLKKTYPVRMELYNKVYKSLKELAQNGENFCKQITSILQQRANLEINYAKGLQKLAAKLSKALQSTKKKKLGKAIESEAIKPTHQVLSMQEKKRKSAKKKLMVSTKKHEALFHLVESSKQSVSKKEKQKLLNKLKKSTEKLEKEDESYYQKNLAGYSTRLKWESTLETCYKSMLELEKERIQLLCNNLNQYSQHISLFGQTLTTCHTQIHCAISKVDVEKDIQALMEETAILSTENKSEFLLTDYFEEDPKNTMDKERRKSLIKPKLLRLQKDIEKASRDKEGLEQKLKTLSSNSSFADAKSQKDAEALMDENSLKLDLLQANSYKLSSVLADLEQRPKPSHPCSACIFKWKEKEHSHTYVRISRPLLTTRLEKTVSKAPSGRQNSPSSSPSGDIVTLHEKKEEGWWFGSLNGKKGHFPAAYVEELPAKAGNAATQS
ncbi:Nostrin [Microtus ochrogaster]|uniref:Nostrin n=1 Tax=Microtus ochrogaster TaxID=79684 RepID=A0A8J6KJQ6_MICOH|nr:Nostrin [Microtus ochrogaster]